MVAAAKHQHIPPANSSKALDLKKLLYLNYFSLRHGFMKLATDDPDAFVLLHRNLAFSCECR
jgi:hypothetical protein